jgi:hypothetical protein
VAPKKNVFPGKHFADPTAKSKKFDYPTSNINLKKYPALAKTFIKEYHSVVTHVLYHFYDTSLITKLSCCMYMYFLWRHHLSPNKSENDQDSDSD